MKPAQKPQSANAASRGTQSFDTFFTSTDHADRRPAGRQFKDKRSFSPGKVLELEILSLNKIFWAAGVDTLMADANMTFHLRTLSRVIEERVRFVL